MKLDVGHAVFLGPGEGETISQEDARSVAIKADRPELVLTESRYAPGERGPDRHVHRAHIDAFYVLAGALVFGLADEEMRAEAGSLVLVPPGLVHTFRNEGPGDARYLNVHAPNGGFADHLRATRDGRDDAADQFDTFDPPADGGRPVSDAVVRGPGEGTAVAVGASRALLKAEESDGVGTFSLAETVLEPGFPGPVRHRHETFADTFYVLAGTLALDLAGESVRAPAGSYALAPPGVTHTFSNPGEEPVRLLNLMAPGGFEQYLKEVARVAGSAPPDPELMARIASRYDFRPAG